MNKKVIKYRTELPSTLNKQIIDMAKKVSIELKRQEQNTDLSTCANCRDVIYSKMYIGYVYSNEIKITKNIDIKLCDSCYSALA
jgi:hypothetical protein